MLVEYVSFWQLLLVWVSSFIENKCLMGLPPRKTHQFSCAKGVGENSLTNRKCWMHFGELSNQRFIGKGHLPLGQLISLCEVGVGDRERL